MRKFSSYGPVNRKLNYYVPREELVSEACTQLMGDVPEEGGHYITIWAPRQTGKSWVMQQVMVRLREQSSFDVLKLNLEHLKLETNPFKILKKLSSMILKELNKEPISVNEPDDFGKTFTQKHLDKPLILILDEFDALCEEAISAVTGAFRNIYNSRKDETDKTMEQKKYLLHSAALIGGRSVVGIENRRGVPFNVQRSIHIPNLTYEEVDSMFKWYEKESGQKVDQQMIDRLFDETRGQPGLTGWFGELLTEGFEQWRPDKSKPLSIDTFKLVYAAAADALPSNNIINIISKARQEPYNQQVLKLFETKAKVKFRFDNIKINFLYMNGVIDKEVKENIYYARFASPFVQKRLFNYFSNELFEETGDLTEPFEDLSPVLSGTELNIPNLLRLYEKYLKKNGQWLFKKAPRRKDLRLFEAVYHFNLYAFLTNFLQNKGSFVYPEFPTGNGKIDLMINYRDRLYGLELKSFSDTAAYGQALTQAGAYGKQTGLDVIYLGVFVEFITEDIRAKYEVPFNHEGVKVIPCFVDTSFTEKV